MMMGERKVKTSAFMQLVVLLLFPLIVAISRLGKVSFFQNPNPSSHDRCALLCDVHDGNRGAMSPPEQLWGGPQKREKKEKTRKRLSSSNFLRTSDKNLRQTFARGRIEPPSASRLTRASPSSPFAA